MTAFATEWDIEQTAGTARSLPTGPVVAVVGFDGSEPARRALQSAAGLVHGRLGRLEVVYVAHRPATAALSGEATAEIETTFDELGRELSEEVRARLDGTESRWHFQRRDGDVADELMAVADDLRRRDGRDAGIVIVLGGPSHSYHRVVSSPVLKVLRHDRFPVIIVP
jgi:hypothetical protein